MTDVSPASSAKTNQTERGLAPKTFIVASPPSNPSTPHLTASSSFPDSLPIAAIGSITIIDDVNASADPQVAPDLSQAALEQYNDIDAYLTTLKADEAKKKKKKKKKKTPDPTSITDNPVLFYELLSPLV
ncbi:hypothetical protein PGT21_025598 [Puccinia graminis f. sp. tritici]|uniref:Uncharacterized protein n=1 Tax=Puccinia graminis f. sp. tritici TaxID=56615 RepID=A0A5B0MCU4_PUCGR|nr:hypothetical protein PGT21_025598 [Puccinia graminis f. sp. tritici]